MTNQPWKNFLSILLPAALLTAAGVLFFYHTQPEPANTPAVSKETSPSADPVSSQEKETAQSNARNGAKGGSKNTARNGSDSSRNAAGLSKSDNSQKAADSEASQGAANPRDSQGEADSKASQETADTETFQETAASEALAKGAVLGHLGKKEEEVSFTEVLLENGIYQIALTDALGEYHYKIAASNSEVLEYSWDTRDPKTNSQTHRSGQNVSLQRKQQEVSD